MKVDPNKNVLVTCTSRDLRGQLVRKGFKQMGKVFDNITRPTTYSLYGKYGRITQRELSGLEVVGHSRFKQTKETQYHRD